MLTFLQKNSLFIALSILILWGGFLRFHDLGAQSYWIDEMFTLTQVSAISEHGYPLLDSGFVEKKDVLLPYILSLLVRLGFDVSDHAAMRSISALSGIALIVVAYTIGRLLWSQRAGLLFAALITFSQWHIAWSRQVRGYELMILLLLSVWMFLLFYERTKKTWFLYCGLGLLCLAVLAKSFAILFFPFFLAYTLHKKHYIPSFAAFLFLITALWIGHDTFSAALSSVHHPNYIERYAFGYLWTFFGVFFSAGVLGMIAALCFDRKNNIFHGIFLLFAFTVLLFFGFVPYVFEARYLLLLTPLLFLYSTFLVEAFARWSKKLTLSLFILVSLLIIDQTSVSTLQFFPQPLYQLEDYTPQPNFREAYATINNHCKEGCAILTPYPFAHAIYGTSNSATVRAIPLSYTGREEDSTIVGSREYYSGAKAYNLKNLSPQKRIQELQEKGNVIVLFDSLSEKRIHSSLRSCVHSSGELLFEDAYFGDNAQRIWIYEFESIREGKDI